MSSVLVMILTAHVLPATPTARCSHRQTREKAPRPSRPSVVSFTSYRSLKVPRDRSMSGINGGSLTWRVTGSAIEPGLDGVANQSIAIADELSCVCSGLVREMFGVEGRLFRFGGPLIIIPSRMRFPASDSPGAGINTPGSGFRITRQTATMITTTRKRRIKQSAATAGDIIEGGVVPHPFESFVLSHIC